MATEKGRSLCRNLKTKELGSSAHGQAFLGMSDYVFCFHHREMVICYMCLDFFRLILSWIYLLEEEIQEWCHPLVCLWFNPQHKRNLTLSNSSQASWDGTGLAGSVMTTLPQAQLEQLDSQPLSVSTVSNSLPASILLRGLQRTSSVATAGSSQISRAERFQIVRVEGICWACCSLHEHPTEEGLQGGISLWSYTSCP